MVDKTYYEGAKVMVEDREDIYEYKMNTSDWPYLFENAKKELAGFDHHRIIEGAAPPATFMAHWKSLTPEEQSELRTWIWEDHDFSRRGRLWRFICRFKRVRLTW